MILPKDTPILGIGSNDVHLGGFSCEPRVQALTTQIINYIPPDTVPYLNERVIAMMHSMGYFPGRGLGGIKNGITEPIEPHAREGNRTGLGIKEEDDSFAVMASSGSSLNGWFVKEGEDFPYCGFQEPWVDSKGQRVQGIEIFFEEGMLSKSAPIHCLGVTVPVATEGKSRSAKEEDVLEMVRELFLEDPVEVIQPRTEAHIMALTEEGQLVDPVCLIRPANSEGGIECERE